MKKKRKNTSTIIIGFLILYLVSMFLSTYLVQCKFVAEYNDALYDKYQQLYDQFSEADYYSGQEGEDSLYFSMYANMILAQVGSHDKYQQIAASIYDRNGKLIAVTSNTFGLTEKVLGLNPDKPEGQTMYLMYPMEDYMNEDEIRELAAYYDSSSVFQKDQKEGKEYNYFTAMGYDPDTLEPSGLEMLKRDKAEFITSGVSQKVVWKWRNPAIPEEKISIMYMISGESIGLVYLPYITHGTEYWQKWQKDEWLQNFPDQYVPVEEEREINVLRKEMTSDVQVPYMPVEGSVSTYYIDIRQTAHPWLAAIDYMKYVYLIGFLLTVTCIIIVIYTIDKIYREKVEVEQMRRDFTNAAAHELRTPLSVIRGFAENLKENTVVEKKDYYLTRMIQQTEQMERLVKEMEQMESLDSKEWNREKNSVSIHSVLREQMGKLEYQISEKNLHLFFETEEDWILEGELSQIEKLIWNLLSNSVEHNLGDGSIWIFLKPNQLVIENTGNPIPKEKMEHIFDMFYTGDESRHYRSVHMGLGLYLAKRICDMHGLKLTIENTDTGVKTVVSVKS